jgi:hypothetical protein
MAKSYFSFDMSFDRPRTIQKRIARLSAKYGEKLYSTNDGPSGIDEHNIVLEVAEADPENLCEDWVQVDSEWLDELNQIVEES